MALNEYDPGSTFPGVVGRTADESAPAWPRPTRAVPGAPNVLMVVDMVFPGWMPWRRFAVAHDVQGYFEQVAEIDRVPADADRGRSVAHAAHDVGADSLLHVDLDVPVFGYLQERRHVVSQGFGHRRDRREDSYLASHP